MSDIYGALELPAPGSEFAGQAPDSALDPIGSYLKATLTAQLGARWRSVAPGEELIKTVITVNPNNALTSQGQLPALFLWRGKSKSTREADDYLISRTQVSALWLLWWDTPTKREKRLPFQGDITRAAASMLARGRHPAWIADRDATAGAATRGSVLAQQAGLFSPIDELDTNEQDIALDPEKSGSPVHYKALSLTFSIAERLARDPALYSVPTISTSNPNNAKPSAGFPNAAALDLTVKQVDDNSIEQLKPAP